MLKKGILFILLCSLYKLHAQEGLSRQMAATAMELWKDSLVMQPGVPVKWAYDEGVFLEGMEGLWKNTGEGKYFNFIKKSMDFFVTDSGTINRYKFNDYTLDNIKNGRILLTLYKVTGELKYYKAAKLLRDQLSSQPRVSTGGFWHKKIYPYQMWLDGLYMAEPFYAEYAATFNEPEDFQDIANQFILMAKYGTDPKTGLMYHGWDESREQKWAGKATGQSPTIWGRAVGWYAMGLVDALGYFPENNPGRDTLVQIFNKLAAAIANVQDAKTGVWYQVMDKAGSKGNYLEASSSCMFVYALAKGVRRGYLPTKYLKIAQKGYAGIKKQFVTQRAPGQINLNGIVGATGLGGNPYRDGSYDYYLSEKVVSDDPKGVGPFLLACDEMEMQPTQYIGAGKTVMLDNYFNNETKKDAAGNTVSYHYTWNDRANSGFSTLGHICYKYGAKTATLKVAPTKENLAKAAAYIIVDPDTKQETTAPNFVNSEDVKNITEWVKAGGTLILMSNDSNNSEFEHFNTLAAAFGIHFNGDSRNKVVKNHFETGTFNLNNNLIFKTGKKVYLKEIATLKVTPPAKPLFIDGKDIIMATAKVGKGRVFAVGDPWFYNEYTDGRKLPADYQNYQAAEDLVKWMLTPDK